LSNAVSIIKFEPIYLGDVVEEEGRERILNSACSHMSSQRLGQPSSNQINSASDVNNDL